MDRWNWLLLILATAMGLGAYYAASVVCVSGCIPGGVCDPTCPKAAYALPLALVTVGLLSFALIRALRINR